MVLLTGGWTYGCSSTSHPHFIHWQGLLYTHSSTGGCATSRQHRMRPPQTPCLPGPGGGWRRTAAPLSPAGEDGDAAIAGTRPTQKTPLGCSLNFAVTQLGAPHTCRKSHAAAESINWTVSSSLGARTHTPGSPITERNSAMRRLPVLLLAGLLLCMAELPQRLKAAYQEEASSEGGRGEC
jgi:hypothetical protein